MFIWILYKLCSLLCNKEECQEQFHDCSVSDVNVRLSLILPCLMQAIPKILKEVKINRLVNCLDFNTDNLIIFVNDLKLSIPREFYMRPIRLHTEAQWEEQILKSYEYARLQAGGN